MIPIVDTIIFQIIVKRLTTLKKYPTLIDIMFQTSNRAHKDKIHQYLVERPIRVIFGYPREPSQLPCVAISHSTENETPMALGENPMQMLSRDLGLKVEDESLFSADATEILSSYIDGTCMQSQTKIGIYSDNADFIMYFANIIKWCLLSARTELFDYNWLMPKVNTHDLRVEPNFQPQTVYSKDIMFSMQHDNWYIRNFDDLELMLEIIQNPQDYEARPAQFKLPATYSTFDLDSDGNGTISIYELSNEEIQPVSTLLKSKLLQNTANSNEEILYVSNSDSEEIPAFMKEQLSLPAFMKEPIGVHHSSIDEEIAGMLPPLSDTSQIVTLGNKPSDIIENNTTIVVVKPTPGDLTLEEFEEEESIGEKITIGGSIIPSTSDDDENDSQLTDDDTTDADTENNSSNTDDNSSNTENNSSSDDKEDNSSNTEEHSSENTEDNSSNSENTEDNNSENTDNNTDNTEDNSSSDDEIVYAPGNSEKGNEELEKLKEKAEDEGIVPTTQNTNTKPIVKKLKEKIHVHNHTKELPPYFKAIDLSNAKDIVHKETGKIVIPAEQQWVFTLMATIVDYNTRKEKEVEVLTSTYKYISESEVEV